METTTAAINADTKAVKINGATYNVVKFGETKGTRTYFVARPAWRKTRRDRHYSLETIPSGQVILFDWGTFANPKQLLTGVRSHEVVRTMEVS